MRRAAIVLALLAAVPAAAQGIRYYPPPAAGGGGGGGGGMVAGDPVTGCSASRLMQVDAAGFLACPAVVPFGVTFTNTGLLLQDTNASHALTIKPGSDITAARTFNLVTGDSDRTFTLTGNLTGNQDVSTAGSPTFVGATYSGLTASSFVATGASKELTSGPIAGLAIGAGCTSSFMYGTATDLFGCATVFGASTVLPDFTNTALRVRGTSGTDVLIWKPGSVYTAPRTFTLTTGDADRSLTLTGDATINQDTSTAGSPTWVGATLSGLTASRLALIDGSKALAANASMTTGCLSKSVSSGASLACSLVTDNASVVTLGGTAPIITGGTASRIAVFGSGKELQANAALTTNALAKATSLGAGLADSLITDDGSVLTLGGTSPIITGGTASRIAVYGASNQLGANAALTTNKLAKATSSGAGLADSLVSDDGSVITLGGTGPIVSATTASRIATFGASKELGPNAAITTNALTKSASSGASLAASLVSDDGAVVTVAGTAPIVSSATASRLAVFDGSKGLSPNGSITTNAIPKSASSGATLVASGLSDDGTTVTTAENFTAATVNSTALTASRLVVSDSSKNLASNGALVTNTVPKAAGSGATLADSRISDDATTIALGGTTTLGGASASVYADTAQLKMSSAMQLGWTTGAFNATQDTFLTREGAAVIQFGTDAAAGAVAYTLHGAEGRLAIDSNVAGGAVTLAPGRSTGTAAGGDFLINRVPTTQASGSAANGFIAALRIVSKAKALTDATATTLFNLTGLGAHKRAGGRVDFCAQATDGTDDQETCGTFLFAAADTTAGAGGETCATPTGPTNLSAASSGTLTCTFAAATGTDLCAIQLNCDTSLTATTLNAYYTVFVNCDNCGVVPQ
jgi:hypothetical protein